MQEQETVNNNHHKEVQESLKEIFDERDIAYKEAPELDQEEPKERDEPEKEPVKKKEAPVSKDKDKEKKVELKKVDKEDDDDDDDDEEDDPVVKTKVEMERLKKSLSDTQRWGHANNRKLKAAIKKVTSLIESGALSEEDGQEVNDLLNSDGTDKEPESLDQKSPFAMISEIVNDKLEDLKIAFEEDEFIDDKLDAFQFFYMHSNDEEKKELLKELSKLIDHPFKLTKRIYSLGSKYYDDFYKDIADSGGIRNYHESQKSEKERLLKKIDKLEKKLSQYKDDEPHHRLPEVNDTIDGEGGDEKDALQELFPGMRSDIRR